MTCSILAFLRTGGDLQARSNATNRGTGASLVCVWSMLLALVLAAVSAMAMPIFKGGVDLVYGSADQLCLGLSASTEGETGNRGYYTAPSIRAGIGLGGASVAVGVSTFAPDLMDSIHLHLVAMKTFERSNWDSDTWVGPQFTVNAAFLKAYVGAFQRLDGEHRIRAQFGGGVALGF